MSGHSVQFTLKTADVVEATKLASSRRLPIPTPLLLAVSVVAAALGILLFGFDDGLTGRYLIPLLIFMIVIVVLVQYVVVPWQARRHAEQSVALKDEMTVEWDDAGIRLGGAHGRATMAWEEFHRWSENGKVILLYQSSMFFNAVPKWPLSAEQAADLVGRLKAAGVKKR